MKIIACDFDNCLSLHGEFPNVGKPNVELFDYLKIRQKHGDKIILWTCRADAALDLAVKFCEVNGLVPDYVNENVPEIVEKFGNDSRKVYAHKYIDDAGITPWDLMNYMAKPKADVEKRPRRKARIVR